MFLCQTLYDLLRILITRRNIVFFHPLQFIQRNYQMFHTLETSLQDMSFYKFNIFNQLKEFFNPTIFRIAINIIFSEYPSNSSQDIKVKKALSQKFCSKLHHIWKFHLQIHESSQIQQRLYCFMVAVYEFVAKQRNPLLMQPTHKW